MSGKDLVSAVGDILLENVARLADVAPTEMIVLREETDWAFIGGDFADAVEEIEVTEPHLIDKEVVEA